MADTDKVTPSGRVKFGSRRASNPTPPVIEGNSAGSQQQQPMGQSNFAQQNSYSNVGAPLHPSGNAGAPQHPSGNAGASQHSSGNAGAPQHPSGNAGAPQHPSGSAGAPQHPSGNAGASQHPSGDAGALQPTGRPTFGRSSDVQPGSGGRFTGSCNSSSLNPQPVSAFNQSSGSTYTNSSMSANTINSNGGRSEMEQRRDGGFHNRGGGSRDNINNAGAFAHASAPYNGHDNRSAGFGGRGDDRNNSNSSNGARPCYMDGNREESSSARHVTFPQQPPRELPARVVYQAPAEVLSAPPVDEHRRASEEAQRVCQELVSGMGKTLYESRDMADIIIVAADGAEVKAHKLLLTIRSSVFSESILGENVEVVDGMSRLAIEGDFSADVVETFIELLYKGEAAAFDGPDAGLDTLELIFLLASKYKVAELVTLSALRLTLDVNAENFIKLLVMADQQGCEVMKDKVMDNYVTKNRKTVLSLDEWKKTKVDHESLYVNVLERLAQA
ncbi:hypothetical protein BV898_09663 [Hypsibius exemplaris]|uniref:BTB domain-containing protein n=1 Tax=Hypsibius exemplaris TaxID=2072580 RepID=A0A1W0WLW0_HYPEX|nr:hypothetical protein BV898_09663 [Hypsibius exemplaris]